MGFSALLALRKGKVETCFFFIILSHSTYSLSSRKSLKRSTNLFSPSKQRIYKLQFLQNLSCQKPFWDQARLPSLVKKQVAVETAVEAAVEAAGEGVIEAAVDEGGLEEVAVDEAKGFINYSFCRT